MPVVDLVGDKNINIRPLVDQFLVWNASREYGKRDYARFHASQWEDCHRKVVYHYYESKGWIKVDKKRASKMADPRLERIFGNGHFVHDRWRIYLTELGIIRGYWRCANFMAHRESNDGLYGTDEKYGIFKPTSPCSCGCPDYLYEEVGFYDEETNWGGHVDGIIDFSGLDVAKWDVGTVQFNGGGKELFVLDFKSINPFSYSKLQEPELKHRTQMQIYLYLSGFPFGLFVYENKGDQSVKEFTVLRDDGWIEQKKEEAIALKQVVNSVNSKGKHVLPPRAHREMTHSECSKCRFRSHCWRA